jgi:hypothetical protein
MPLESRLQYSLTVTMDWNDMQSWHWTNPGLMRRTLSPGTWRISGSACVQQILGGQSPKYGQPHSNAARWAPKQRVPPQSPPNPTKGLCRACSLYTADVDPLSRQGQETRRGWACGADGSTTKENRLLRGLVGRMGVADGMLQCGFPGTGKRGTGVC